MLVKLIRYDFKAISKQMFPVFTVLLSASVIVAVMTRVHNVQSSIYSFVIMIYMLSVMASMLGTVYFVAARFNDSLLKNEGYLYFALPVKTSTHIIAKILNAFIWALMEGAVLCLSSMIYVLILGGLRDFRQMVDFMMSVFNYTNSDIILAFFRSLVLIIVEMLAFTCLIYATMAVGHLSRKHPRLLSIGFVVLVMMIRVYPMGFDQIWYFYTAPLFSSLFYGLLTWHILDRRLNLE